MRKSKNTTYWDLVNSADLLTYLCNNNISSVSEFESAVNCSDEKLRQNQISAERLNKRIEYLNKNHHDDNVTELKTLQAELKEVEENTEQLSKQKSEITRMYKIYLEQIKCDEQESYNEKIENETER